MNPLLRQCLRIMPLGIWVPDRFREVCIEPSLRLGRLVIREDYWSRELQEQYKSVASIRDGNNLYFHIVPITEPTAPVLAGPKSGLWARTFSLDTKLYTPRAWEESLVYSVNRHIHSWYELPVIEWNASFAPWFGSIVTNPRYILIWKGTSRVISDHEIKGEFVGLSPFLKPEAGAVLPSGATCGLIIPRNCQLKAILWDALIKPDKHGVDMDAIRTLNDIAASLGVPCAAYFLWPPPTLP